MQKMKMLARRYSYKHATYLRVSDPFFLHISPVFLFIYKSNVVIIFLQNSAYDLKDGSDVYRSLAHPTPCYPYDPTMGAGYPYGQR